MHQAKRVADGGYGDKGDRTDELPGRDADCSVEGAYREDSDDGKDGGAPSGGGRGKGHSVGDIALFKEVVGACANVLLEMAEERKRVETDGVSVWAEMERIRQEVSEARKTRDFSVVVRKGQRLADMYCAVRQLLRCFSFIKRRLDLVWRPCLVSK